MSTTSFRPVDGTKVRTVDDNTSDEVAAVVDAAVLAAPLLRDIAPSARRSWLYAIADALDTHIDELTALADSETALGIPRLTAEVGRTVGQLRFYADVAVEGSYLEVAIDSATATTPRLVRLNRPLGPVAVFGASNFPFAFSVLGNDTASALAAGCPVVVKAHPAHAALSLRLGDIALDALRSADAPVGTLALVSGQQAGADLVRNDGIEAVAFTGSQVGGMAIRGIAEQRRRVIPVYAEMGTVNPVVLTPACGERIADVAAGFVASFTLGAGQYCTKPGLLLAPAGCNASAVVAEALDEAQPRPVMLTESIADAVTLGVRELVAAGATVERWVSGPGAGWSAPAVVLSAPITALMAGSRLLSECFGAVAIVVEYANDGELQDAFRALQGGLAATVIPGDADDPHGARYVERLAETVGRVTVGDWPTGVAYTWAQQHGGPWPATSDSRATSVGAAALHRFVRPVTYQSTPDAWVPRAGRADNPWSVPRRIDGRVEPRSGV